MGKKRTIITWLLVITILLIGVVRIVLKRDIEETKNARLRFFSSYLEIQKRFVFYSFANNADLTFNLIKSDQSIESFIKRLTNVDSLLIETINNDFIRHTDPLFVDLKKRGFSLFKFTSPFIQKNFNTNNNCNHCIAFQKIKNLTPLKTEGLHIDNEFIGYKYIYPYLIDGEYVGNFEIGFDYHQIKDLIKQSNKEAHVGFLVAVTDTLKNHRTYQKNEFQLSIFGENIWFEHDFILPDIFFKSKDFQNQLIEEIEKAKENETTESFSLYLKTGKDASAISFTKMLALNEMGTAFLISFNHDFLLAKAKENNNAILIITIFIILSIMTGMIYMIINRLNIIRDKLIIQKSEENLIKLNESKDKFFSIVAHDLKNPFNGIMGLSDYLITDYENIDDQERKEIIDDINIASKNAFNLLQNLLEWTRTQSGLIKNNPIVIEPQRIVAFSLETVTNLAKTKEIEIKEEYLTEHLGFADENLVATIIRNLATNAIKFSPRNSTIEIIVNHYKDELTFAVKDVGIGLTSNEIDQLFRIDVNFHKRGTEKETGTGLGLKLCKEFVEYCNGRIWVVSEPGKGSTFFFTIPSYTEKHK